MTTDREDPAGGAEEDAKAVGAEPDGLEGKPDTPLWSEAELLEALRWAFQGEEIAPGLLERFAAHAQRMLVANRVVNLTAIVDPREIAAKHYLDSWRVTR